MARALVSVALVLAACSEDPAPTSANQPPTPAVAPADASPPSWWETDSPCPDGAALDRSAPDKPMCRKPDGTAHGRFVQLRADKTPRLEGSYVDGKRDGTFTHYDPSGKTLGTTTFERGSGRWVEYADDGAVALEGPYRDGKRAGDWRWRWSADTDAGVIRLEYIATYHDGAVIKTTLIKNGDEIEIDALKAAGLELPDGAPTRSTGILGILSQQQGGAFASLTGSADFSSGLDDVDVIGGLIGNEVGEMSGGWGYGIKGTGPGGGGDGWGTIGTGRYGTIGKDGGGTGFGRGGFGRGKRRGPVPSVRIGNARVVGDLDKNIIRRYVRRALPRIRYCYEKRLLIKPALKGTATVRFTIAPSGSVVKPEAKGFDKAVDRCLDRAFKSIRFPKPKGGGMVKVTYPFTFRPK